MQRLLAYALHLPMARRHERKAESGSYIHVWHEVQALHISKEKHNKSSLTLHRMQLVSTVHVREKSLWCRYTSTLQQGQLGEHDVVDCLAVLVG